MCDVGEGPAVDEGGYALAGLHEVGQNRVLEQNHQGARGFEVVGGDRRSIAVDRHDQSAQAQAQIIAVVGETQHGHDLGRGRDIEAGLSRHAFESSAEANDHAPQGSVALWSQLAAARRRARLGRREGAVLVTHDRFRIHGPRASIGMGLAKR